MAEHGDLELISDECRPINAFEVEVSDGQYPEDWDMPKGFKFIRVSEDR
jgi:hypothetical protein